MKLLWLAFAAVMLAGCAVVPVPGPYVAPNVSIGVGVPVYRHGYRHGGYYRHPYYGRGHYHRHPYYRGW